ncbi:hypothetical protein MicloDRAFT_00037650 [Microvirga lotononidis]|uniref:Uncharacterized protein n=1 Tax=Microvirga lotononidis TaxID=864069 RepID=I4YTB6_9HYPH|nr:hypothetical protein MicloDRAFT_00037650 [Microvirga lotononidis]
MDIPQEPPTKVEVVFAYRHHRKQQRGPIFVSLLKQLYRTLPNKYTFTS